MSNEKLAGLTRYSGITIANSYVLESEEFFLARKVEALLATTSTAASASPVPRAQGGNTCDKIVGSSPADAGGLTPYNSIYGEKCYRGVEVDALLATKAAQKTDPALEALLRRIDESWANYERMGEVCSFEGQPMMYVSTLAEIVELSQAVGASPAPSAKQELSEEEKLRRLSVQGMADCMDMVHNDLIEMGIIDKSVAPMFIPEAVAGYVKRLAAPSAKQEPSVWQGMGTAPIDGTEILIRFPKQGNVKSLANYNTIHNFWMSKGNAIFPVEQGCEWTSLPSDAATSASASPAAAVAAPAPAPVAGSQQSVVELLSKALEDIAQPASAGCGCDFPCQCETDAAEAINAGAMRDIAHEALKAAALAAAAPAVPVPVEQDQAQDAARYRALNTPEVADFIKGVEREALHQRERWGSSHDAGKAPEDWFWLLGYLGGKALSAAKAGNAEKALHHTISSAASLLNWHAAILGVHTAMRPGIEPPAAAAPSLQQPKEGSQP